jgi:UDP-3-O-[3-hydroxymyristoyl] glucosamine N-acyltransferase
MSAQVTVGEVAARIGGDVVGDVARVVTGVAAVECAGPTDLTYIESGRFQALLQGCQAAAVILPPGVTAPPQLTAIRVDEAVLAMARAIDVLFPSRPRFEGIATGAALGERVVIGESVGIGPRSLSATTCKSSAARKSALERRSDQEPPSERTA